MVDKEFIEEKNKFNHPRFIKAECFFRFYNQSNGGRFHKNTALLKIC